MPHLISCASTVNKSPDTIWLCRQSVFRASDEVGSLEQLAVL